MLGAAWMVGALSVLEDELGTDLREFDQLVGTSAGSVLAGLLGAGVSVADLRTHQLSGTPGVSIHSSGHSSSDSYSRCNRANSWSTVRY